MAKLPGARTELLAERQDRGNHLEIRKTDTCTHTISHFWEAFMYSLF